jgi:hypothetical protein
MASRHRGCKRKKRYETRRAAENSLAGLIRRRYANPDYMHVYKCRWCGWYHVGHLPGGGRRT